MPTDNGLSRRLIFRYFLMITILAGILTAFFSIPTISSVKAQQPTPDPSQKRLFLPILAVPDRATLKNPHSTLITYQGSATCVNCHLKAVTDMHGSVHYQWSGFTPNVPGSTTGGKISSLNDFCNYPGVNTWLGKMTNVDGVVVDGGCATCHVGMGLKPTTDQSSEQLGNIDCLVCHSDQYKRTVQLVNGVYKMVPDPTKMSVNIQTALSNISLPTKAACINCHAYGGGGANNKRGDIEPILANPTSKTVDVHMAPKSVGGAGFNCTTCHITQNHRIAGRGSDLKPTDLAITMRCDSCHTLSPHNNQKLNSHTARIECTTCHIPTFARHTSTDMYRDFRVSELDVVKRLYEPAITRQSNVIPVYKFFNGNSTFYELNQKAIPGVNGKVSLSTPLGSIGDSTAKISPFKYHTATQPVDPVSQFIIPLKMGIVFQTGNMDNAIRSGAAAMGWTLPKGYGFLETERYMEINHTIQPANNALTCTSCHYGSTRLDFKSLGYTPKTTRNNKPLCASCHGDKSNSWSASQMFDRVHSKHVDGKNINCIECHYFSKAQ